jgi:hypothetical protein
LPALKQVHVDARWALSDNRNSLVTSTSASTRAQVEWNTALLRDAAASLWAETLLALRHETSTTVSQFYRVWPNDFAESGGGVGAVERALDPTWAQVSLKNMLAPLTTVA